MISEQGELIGPLLNELRPMVSLMDHLRDAGLQTYIKLPRIVTLGVQSSGKSSVLENIVGLDFLPRGDGVVTRRPLELRMVHVENSERPIATFQGIDRQFVNFAEVKEIIQRLTNEVAGSKKAIVDDPIILTIYSTTCPDLTLIDLPGITRIPIEDQPQDIERITKEMASRYISDPRTIILCVIPANADMSTSEALQMARHYDKDGTRTIGVITKIDIMDRGTNARRMLLGQEIPLRLGYIGIKNRSQQEISQNVSVESALNDERRFFDTHEVYSGLPQNLLGTEFLTSKLSKVMFVHIRQFIPDIMSDISQRLKECEDRLVELGPSTPTEPGLKVQLLWTMVTDLIEIFKNNIKGKYDRRTSSNISKDLEGGLQIKQSFYRLLKQFTGNYRATQGYPDSEVERAIMIHEGDSIPGFPSSDVFLYLIHPQLESLNDPVFLCINEVSNILENLALTIIERLFARFPGLISELSDSVILVLNNEREKCKVIVQSVIEAEETYVFTNDPDYIQSFIGIASKSDVKGNLPFVQEVRQRIDSYFKVVIRNIRDIVPQLIGCFLVKRAMDQTQIQLFERINIDSGILDMLTEPEHIMIEREKLNSQLNTLKEAQKILRREASLVGDRGDMPEINPIKEEAKELIKPEKAEKVLIERQSNIENKPYALDPKTSFDNKTSFFGENFKRKITKSQTLFPEVRQ